MTDTHVLLIKNVVGSNQWTLPGGGYHANETGKQCARREVREELGIAVPALKDLGKASEMIKGATWHYDCFVSHLESMPSIQLSIEISEAQWFAIGKLPGSIQPFARHLIQQIEATGIPVE